MAMQGFIVRHTFRGIGKIESASDQLLSVKFLESDSQATFERSAFAEKELKRHTLPIKSICESNDRKCLVEKITSNGGPDEPKKYHVTFHDDGLRTELSEVELTPTGLCAQLTSLEKIQNQDQGSYSLFGPREKLWLAIQQQLRNGNGLRALLSSRIDLLPHQAFVAGAVLLDESRRYLLADEVGLGKTIEAGIVIHDLLIHKPDAKILILCPGALTQQWLCELYSKFAGQVFRMLDMLNLEKENWSDINRLIASFTDGALKNSAVLLEQDWDMVVIDEVHNLLSSQPLYEFAHKLSQKSPSILLLSAIPAKRREDEFLRLLALLEPDRYTDEIVANKEAFQQLFEDQPAIGRTLRLIRVRLRGLTDGSFTKDETLEQIEKLSNFTPVQGDPYVNTLKQKLPMLEEGDFKETVEDLIHHIGEKYRINRRILRNRRQRLIEDDQITEIHRLVDRQGYRSDQLEHEVNNAIDDLLMNCITKEQDGDLIEVFAGIAWQSMVHPQATVDLFEGIRSVESGKINANGREFLKLGFLAGSVSWENYLQLLRQAVRPLINDELLHQVIEASNTWKRQSASYSRIKHLIKILKQLKKSNPKLLIFVGYPAIADLITDQLRATFGEESTTEFNSDLEREEKEANVRQFRTDPSTWLLVSDESGGEGRNFQFADLLIHFDTPWHVSRIEQRIGRLDRLGRVHPEVKSIVIYDESSVEGGLIECYDKGLGVYTQSISGLEFALREVQSKMIRIGIDSGRDGLVNIIADIQETVETERDRDESEAILDEASFNQSKADQFLRVRSSDESEIQLEEAFLNFFKMIATSGIHPINDLEFPEGLWSFKADRIHQIKNNFTHELANKEFQGTFRRSIAQERVDLDFFGIGNRLFEAIYHSLHVENIGRTYAVEITRPLEPKWIGFEFVFYPSPDQELLGNNLGLQNRARQYFNFRPIHVFCNHKGEIETETAHLLTIRKSMTRETKDKVWSNFTGEKAHELADQFQSTSWSELIGKFSETARKDAHSNCSALVSPRINEALHTLNMQIENVKSLETNSVYIEPLERLRNSIKNWSVQLDAIGFLSINGGISERLKHG